MALVGEGAIVTSVLPDVFPTIDVEDLQPDGWKLSGWDLCVGFDARVPGAGLMARFALENIVGTNVIAVLERIDIAVGADAFVTIETNSAGTVLTGTDNGTRRIRDFRPNTDGLPILAVTSNDTIPGSPVSQFKILADTTHTVELDNSIAVIAPASMIVVRIGTANVRGDVTFWWRERPMDPAEALGS